MRELRKVPAQKWITHGSHDEVHTIDESRSKLKNQRQSNEKRLLQTAIHSLKEPSTADFIETVGMGNQQDLSGAFVYHTAPDTRTLTKTILETRHRRGKDLHPGFIQ